MNETKRTKIHVLNRITSEILSDRKKANQIVDLLEKFNDLSGDENELYNDTLIRCLTKVFTYFIDIREMVLLKKTDDDDKNISTLNTYKSWLIKLYESAIDSFVKVITNSNKQFSINLRKQALLSLIKFLEEEGKFPFRPAPLDNDYINSSFPVYLLEKIISVLASETVYNQDLIDFYATYFQYDDFTYYTMAILHRFIDNHQKSQSAALMANLLDFIYPIRLQAPRNLLPESLRQESFLEKQLLSKKSNGKKRLRLCELQSLSSKIDQNFINISKKKFKFDYERDAQLYSTLWVKFLSFHLPPSTYKRVLVYLDKFAIQHFSNPLVLADFLITSFQVGGIISLLTLSPLYTLIQKCNLEYPKFYKQLYILLEPAIIYVKYRPKFLFWCDLFLTSTHISSAIVASFAKKFARLTLTSTPDTIYILLHFIGNLFIRHPMIKSMLIYKEFPPEQDPFLMSECDPEQTNALQSCMWELKMLQSHYHPEIKALSEKICTDLPKYEWNLENILETNMDDIIEKSSKQLESVEKLTYDLECDMYHEL